MKVYAPEPPWTEPDPHGLVWKRGEELWDGSGYEWTLEEASPWYIQALFDFQPGEVIHVEWLEDELFPKLSAEVSLH